MRIILHLMGLIAGFFMLKSWAVIEGTLGPIIQTTGSAPVEGTDEVQTVTLDGTPNGGSFKLSFLGRVTAAIAWSATTNTLLANVRNALMGVASVQTLTFTAITSGTFRLRYRGQETDVITWSNTSNTLRDRVDAALEALPNIGTAGVVAAVGTMTSGLGTLTVTFAARGTQPLLQVADKRLVGTGAALTVEITTDGVDGPIGDSGVTVADSTLSSGVGDFTITFGGPNYAKKAQPLIEVASNAMTSSDSGDPATVAVAETTPGVDAFGRGILIGGEVVDTVSGDRYVNQGTEVAPDYTAIT